MQSVLIMFCFVSKVSLFLVIPFCLMLYMHIPAGHTHYRHYARAGNAATLESGCYFNTVGWLSFDVPPPRTGKQPGLMRFLIKQHPPCLGGP